MEDAAGIKLFFRQILAQYLLAGQALAWVVRAKWRDPSACLASGESKQHKQKEGSGQAVVGGGRIAGCVQPGRAGDKWTKLRSGAGSPCRGAGGQMADSAGHCVKIWRTGEVSQAGPALASQAKWQGRGAGGMGTPRQEVKALRREFCGPRRNGEAGQLGQVQRWA